MERGVASKSGVAIPLFSFCLWVGEKKKRKKAV